MAPKAPNARQLRFIDEWLVDLNASAAYVRAGYAAKNANVDASKLLSKLMAFPDVATRVAAAKARQAEASELSAQRVLKELMAFAFVDIGEAFGTDGQLLPLGEMPASVRRAISSIETASVGDAGVTVTKVKFVDKARGLELLGKHLKLYTEKVQHEGGVSVEVVDPYAEAKR